MKDVEIKRTCTLSIYIALGYVVAMVLLAWLLVLPIEGLYNLTLFLVALIWGGWVTFREIRRVSYKVYCSGCKEDIYKFIGYGEIIKCHVKFCPMCGCAFNQASI